MLIWYSGLVHKGVTLQFVSVPVFNTGSIQQRSSGLQAGGLSVGGLKNV